MKHISDGIFQINSNDWMEILIWSGVNTSYVSVWEKPMFTSQVARWFIERGASGDGVTITMKDTASRAVITIHDPLLALEFKMRWCTDRSGSIGKSYSKKKWSCCEV